MTLIALLIGIAVPATLGWLLLRTIEGHHPLLLRGERIVYGFTLGPTAMMLIILVCHALTITQITFTGFLAPVIICIAVLLLWNWKRGTLQNSAGAVLQHHPSPSRPLLVLIVILLLWSGIKVVSGTVDAFTVPTYWDDSFNNWNMRGKLFYHEKAIVLEIPGGNDVTQDSTGVSSYPMSLPLMKTWLSTLRGSWNESLVNGIQVLWYLGIIGTLWYGLRRRLSPAISALGVYAFIALPLVLIHGVNPYAEVFVASHLLITLLCVTSALDATTEKNVMGWLSLSGLSLGLLAFTKNEGMALYVPLVIASICWTLYAQTKAGVLSQSQLKRTALKTFALAGLIIIPWLAFKYAHSLSFGNGKAVSALSLSFSPRAIQSIWYQLSHEPNFLLLPLLLPVTVILAGGDRVRGSKALLIAFVLTALVLQWGIFVFVTALATEAVKQTGLSRGMVHIAPVAVFVLVLLWEEILRNSHKK
jgi:hypothetical protein